jgi:hypothetical protein
LKFFKSIRRKNGMVFKGHPRGRLSSQRSGVPVEALPLPFFFLVGVGGGGGGVFPTPAGPKGSLCDPALAGNKDSGNDRVWSLAPDAIRRVVWACACL